MSNIYTQLFQDTFQRANEDPLNPTIWTPNFSATRPDGSYSQLQIINNECGADGVLLDVGVEFVNVSMPPDQYVECVVGNFREDVDDEGSEYQLLLRSDVASSNLYAAILNCESGGGSSAAMYVYVADFPSPIGSSYAIPGGHVHTGDVFRFEVFGTTLVMKYNGVLAQQSTDTTFSSGLAGIGLAPDSSLDLSQTTTTRFSAGGINIPYSVSDTRSYGNFPNDAVYTQQTGIFTLTSNPSHPATIDSRAAGALIDCRISPNIPENSRTPGTFGPGE